MAHKTPSVTKIIQPWIARELELARAAGNLEDAATRGTAVHGACAAIAQGLLPIHSKDLDGYVRSYREWHNAAVESVHAVEIRLRIDGLLPFNGKPDLICRIKNDPGLCLVDLKTPVAANKSWRLQLAAYAILAQENGFDVRRIASLRLRANGARAIFQEYTCDLSRDYQVFQNALATWYFFNS